MDKIDTLKKLYGKDFTFKTHRYLCVLSYEPIPFEDYESIFKIDMDNPCEGAGEQEELKKAYIDGINAVKKEGKTEPFLAFVSENEPNKLVVSPITKDGIIVGDVSGEVQEKFTEINIKTLESILSHFNGSRMILEGKIKFDDLITKAFALDKVKSFILAKCVDDNECITKKCTNCPVVTGIDNYCGLIKLSKKG